MQQQIIELEKKLAFQEHLLEELNGALIEQQKRIDQLEKRLREVQGQVNSGAPLVKDIQDEQPPPHY